MNHSIDLASYLARIGYAAAEIRPTLQTLHEIIARHTRAIPFENLDVLMRWPVRLDLSSLEAKLVSGRRGGYCFEQNTLLKAALEAAGFRVTGLAARVLWNASPDAMPARQHMLLQVDIDGDSWIADVGFGGMTPTAALRLATDAEQRTPHENFRLRRRGEDFLLEGKAGETWRSLYRFDLQPQLPADYEVSNWYVSTHPQSHFLRELSAARAEAGRRYTLSNREFTVRHLDGRTERRTLSSAGEIRETLQNCFTVRLPETPDLDGALDEILARTEPAVRT